MSLVFLPRFVAVNSAGVPYPNARLYVYKATTLNALGTYTSETFGTPHAQPIEADANGLFPVIYQDPSSGFNLRLILKDQNDVLLWDEDNIPRAQTNFSSITAGAISATTLDLSGLATLDGNIAIVNSAPDIELFETDAAADNRRWHVTTNGNQFQIITKTDGGSAGKTAISITRSGTAISAIDIGNATDAPTISFNGVAPSGSFTGTLNGMTATITGTINYKIQNGVCTLYAISAIFGTSNSAAQLIMTGLPSACQPSGKVPVVRCSCLLDNSVALNGRAEVSGSAINFYLDDPTTVANRVTNTTIFTAANSKGLQAGWSITYPL